MTNKDKNNFLMSSQVMTEMQEAVFQVEAFLDENYMFRRNELNGKLEALELTEASETIETPETFSPPAGESEGSIWQPVTPQFINGIVRKAKKAGIGGDKTPRQNIEEYILSDAIPTYNPIREYLDNLPEWDGRNHVADLFSRLPGITTEQMSWCATWLRSAVAHWLGMDMLHGNECVPVLIGQQGCGKSTFALRLLPEQLREFYLDHINFGNKFDSEMALTHNLLVNIDEFANMGSSQQGKLKQTLSKVKVNGRPIFGKAQEDRSRFASFIATTNNEHPLCDTTGSRRYLCLKIRKGMMIDNVTPIPYPQLYAQLLHELLTEGIPYWFSNDEVQRIQKSNIPFFQTDDMESMVTQCYRLPETDDEGEWTSCKDICLRVSKLFPSLKTSNSVKIRIGQTLKALGCSCKRYHLGMLYKLVPLYA